MVNVKNITVYSSAVTFFIIVVIGIIVPVVNIVDLQKKKDATSDVDKYQKLQDEYILYMFFLILACVGLMVLLFVIIKYRCDYNVDDFDFITTGTTRIVRNDVGGGNDTTVENKRVCLKQKLERFMSKSKQKPTRL